MKQTAVEWFNEEINKLNVGTDARVFIAKLFEQAKGMEKQQIVDCGNTCAIKQHIHIEKVNKMTMDEMLEFANTKTLTFGEEYYNETFKNQLQG